MKLTYQEFERRYLQQAECLTTRLSNRAAYELCRVTYEHLNGHDMTNCQEVFVALARKYYELFVQNVPSAARRVAVELFGEASLTYAEEWIESRDMLSLVEPVLLEKPLLSRLVGAFRILDQGYVLIANQLDAAIEDVSSMEIQTATTTTLTEVERNLAQLRDVIVRRTEIDEFHDWLTTVAMRVDDPVHEVRTWSNVLQLTSRKGPSRYARKADRYAWLRDRWKECAKSLRRSLAWSDFIKGAPE